MFRQGITRVGSQDRIEFPYRRQFLIVAGLAVFQCHRLFVLECEQELFRPVFVLHEDMVPVHRVKFHIPFLPAFLAEPYRLRHSLRIFGVGKQVILVACTENADIDARALQAVGLPRAFAKQVQILLHIQYYTLVIR